MQQNWATLSCAFPIALIANAFAVQRYHPDQGCMGCQLDAQDVAIFFGVVIYFIVTMITLFYKMRKLDDPLHVYMDLRYSIMVYIVFAIIAYTLVVVDPGELMRSQQVDWYIIETVAAVLLHYRRCVVQILRANRVHEKPKIPLLTVLNHKEMSVLFEKHLGRELASENILFWREAVKYKLGFEADFDYSQQLGKIIIQQFIGKRAQLEINISEKQVANIMSKSRSGFLGKALFDEAMVEVYQLMESGPYVRFLRSSEFTAYANSTADFSLLQIEGGLGNKSSNNIVLDSNISSADDDKKFAAVIDWVRKL